MVQLARLTTFRLSNLRVALAMSAVLLLGIVASFAWAQGATTAEARAEVIAVSPSNPIENVPQEMVPGYAQLKLESPADNGATLTLYRLKPGATLDELRPAVEAVDVATSGQGNPSEAINAALEIGDVVAELDVAPGVSESAGVELTEGEYVLDYAAHPVEESAVPQRTFRTLTVRGEAQADAPDADVEVNMMEFAFTMPQEVSSGEQLWRVTNSGKQMHHMVIFRLNEGVTLDDMRAWLDSEDGPPPGEQAAYIGILSPGFSADYTLDLTPGHYVGICFMPDHRGDATGQPHFMLGMIQEFQVTGGAAG